VKMHLKVLDKWKLEQEELKLKEKKEKSEKK
jgi:hypothetical protein